MKLKRKIFSYHVDGMDETGQRFIKVVKKNPETGKEEYSPRIYYNKDGSITLKDDSGKVIRELPERK